MSSLFSFPKPFTPFKVHRPRSKYTGPGIYEMLLASFNAASWHLALRTFTLLTVNFKSVKKPHESKVQSEAPKVKVRAKPNPKEVPESHFVTRLFERGEGRGGF